MREMTKLPVVLGVMAVVLSGCARVEAPAGETAKAESGGKIVDLTHPFDENTIYWPTAEPFQLRVDSKGVTPAGYYYEANSFSAAEHGGTHLDAPVHFARDGWRTDEIPLRRLMGPAVVIDVSPRALADRDYQVGVADLHGWEAENGRLPDGSILLLRTGYGAYWPNPVQYLGTALRGEAGVAELRFPGLSPEAAGWLVRERSVSAVGIDTPSIDYGRSTQFESHRVLFEANIPAFENVDLPAELPSSGFRVIALPMKIGGGSGGPLRIVAILP